MKIGDIVTAVIYTDKFPNGTRINGKIIDMVDGFVIIEDEWDEGVWQALEVDCEVAEDVRRK